jgi:hypothetical protein
MVQEEISMFYQVYFTICTIISGLSTGFFVGTLTKDSNLGSFAGLAVVSTICAITANKK